MTNGAWESGLAILLHAGLGGWAQDERESTARSQVYRAALDDLSDAAWEYAVQQTLRRQASGFWPSVPELRAYADEYRTPALRLVPREPAKMLLSPEAALALIRGRAEAERKASA